MNSIKGGDEVVFGDFLPAGGVLNLELDVPPWSDQRFDLAIESP